MLWSDPYARRRKLATDPSTFHLKSLPKGTRVGTSTGRHGTVLRCTETISLSLKARQLLLLCIAAWALLERVVRKWKSCGNQWSRAVEELGSGAFQFPIHRGQWQLSL